MMRTTMFILAYILVAAGFAQGIDRWADQPLERGAAYAGGVLWPMSIGYLLGREVAR